MINGFTKIPNKLFLSDKLDYAQKLVLGVLLMHSMQKKDCFPSRSTIAKETGVYIRTVDKAIKGLKKKRFIVVSTINGKVNSYKINF